MHPICCLSNYNDYKQYKDLNRVQRRRRNREIKQVNHGNCNRFEQYCRCMYYSELCTNIILYTTVLSCSRIRLADRHSILESNRAPRPLHRLYHSACRSCRISHSECVMADRQIHYNCKIYIFILLRFVSWPYHHLGFALFF